MLRKVTIKTITSSDTKNDGSPRVYASGPNEGKSYSMYKITTDEQPGEEFSTNAMAGSKVSRLSVGETAVLSFTETTSADGQKTFKNFSFPTKAQLDEHIANTF